MCSNSKFDKAELSSGLKPTISFVGLNFSRCNPAFSLSSKKFLKTGAVVGVKGNFSSLAISLIDGDGEGALVGVLKGVIRVPVCFGTDVVCLSFLVDLSIALLTVSGIVTSEIPEAVSSRAQVSASGDDVVVEAE